ncbi:hypothetical protein PROH_01140 [Prochlorothrix hollandica PCC 9006 = CALU 1027]|uniref:Uncharacterized protein n=1 Tax=Prochlorothrix hollandica PCC 9006 = CALU 1027 TaxID=317619 RepID=A0A0M2PX92_PROHO|nr:hypothetical protein PROH_01140 [Prochlorothrix hollandica PCC 9006 = CALU 1027]
MQIDSMRMLNHRKPSLSILGEPFNLASQMVALGKTADLWKIGVYLPMIEISSQYSSLVP